MLKILCEWLYYINNEQHIHSFWFISSDVRSQGHCLTHWGQAKHICVGNLTIIVSDNGLSPDRRQAIIWTNATILLIWSLGTNLSEILIGIQTFSFKKIHLKMSSVKWPLFCLGLNVFLNLAGSSTLEFRNTMKKNIWNFTQSSMS